MKILVACEYSGRVREAFRALGHEAWSCDLLAADDASPYHIQGDCVPLLGEGWDMLIAHPPCTYLTNSAAWAFTDGPYHQKVKPGTLVGARRRESREEALHFVETLMRAPVPMICVENPRGCIGTRLPVLELGFARTTVQPYDFGDDASKATDLWLRGLPPLRPTKYVEPRVVEGKPRWGNQTNSGQNRLSPSEDRWKVRSVTYQGIADAMAAQWGRV